jgi:nitroimidazol reductase NimA-like FMN-containing flavoprotein (pyridoxamine 5'-phosphate oxidase superfamily)
VTASPPNDAELVEIDREECLALLASHGVGRIALVVGNQPLVFPVNYCVDRSSVVFRTDPGTKLHGVRGKRVAFQIDHVDPFYHEGWSVLLVGMAEEVTDTIEIRRLSTLPIRPWGVGEKSHWVRVHGPAISGRRLIHRI